MAFWRSFWKIWPPFCRAGGDSTCWRSGCHSFWLQSNLCGLPVSRLDRHSYPSPPPSWLAAYVELAMCPVKKGTGKLVFSIWNCTQHIVYNKHLSNEWQSMHTNTPTPTHTYECFILNLTGIIVEKNKLINATVFRLHCFSSGLLAIQKESAMHFWLLCQVRF